MPRIARIVGVGYPHHVIQRGNNRQAVFFDDDDRKTYIRFLKKYSIECGLKVYSYCLMSNHVHLLVVPEKADSLAKALQKISLTFTQYTNRKYKRTGRLWECRFYSSIIDTESYLWKVSRYIECNPVRAGIAGIRQPTDYIWSSARYHISNDLSSENWIQPIGQDAGMINGYIQFLNQYEDENEVQTIRRSIASGKPLGSERFISHVSEMFGIRLNLRLRGRPRHEK